MLSLPPLAAETIGHIGSFPITNTMLNGLIATALFAVFAYFLNRSVRNQDTSKNAPRGIANFFEGLIEFVIGYIDNVTKDRKKTLKFLPIVGGVFFFIVLSNWMGLLPGMSSIGFFKGDEFVPLLRSANTDLNLTLSMALVAVIGSHIFGIMAIGFFKYANKFIKLGDIWNAIKSGKPINIMVAFIEFFVGLIEIFSEAAKMVSLSLRLFGNIFAGEVLLTVLASLISGYGAFGIPLPFMGLELLVGVVQATVFAMLTLVYLTIATTEIHGHGDESHDAHATEGHA